MFLYNNDGSVAEMCGNGLRCFAKHVYDYGIVKKERFTVETLAGVMEVAIDAVDGVTQAVTANLGRASFDRPSIPMVGEGECDRMTIHAWIVTSQSRPASWGCPTWWSSARISPMKRCSNMVPCWRPTPSSPGRPT